MFLKPGFNGGFDFVIAFHGVFDFAPRFGIQKGNPGTRAGGVPGDGVSLDSFADGRLLTSDDFIFA